MKVFEITENFADGKKKGKSRPGRVKRAGASAKKATDITYNEQSTMRVGGGTTRGGTLTKTDQTFDGGYPVWTYEPDPHPAPAKLRPGSIGKNIKSKPNPAPPRLRPGSITDRKKK